MNIGEISAITGLSAYTLRYYEKIGLLIDIRRDSKGHRHYRDRDLVWIEFIQRLKATNMPLAEIKRFARLRIEGDQTIGERVALLQKHEDRILRQIQALENHRLKVHEKIRICRQGGRPRPVKKVS